MNNMECSVWAIVGRLVLLCAILLISPQGRATLGFIPNQLPEEELATIHDRADITQFLPIQELKGRQKKIAPDAASALNAEELVSIDELLGAEELGSIRLSLMRKGQLTIMAYNYYGEIISGEINTFASSNEAGDAVNFIMKYTGLKPNFIVLGSNDISNALAVIYHGKRYIVYNPSFMQDIKFATKTNWSAVSILAHEIGHHLNGHTMESGGSNPAIELEADEYSGFILEKMGSSLDAALAAVRSFGSDVGSATHPPKQQRITAITKGWKSSYQITHKTVSSSGTKSSPSNSPIATPRQVPHDTKKKNIINTLILASSIYAESNLTWKVAPLRKVFTGNALKDLVRIIKEQQQQNQITVSKLHNLEVKHISFPRRATATAKVSETWESMTFDASSGECIYYYTPSEHMQTVSLIQRSGDWLVTKIVFNNSPSQAISCRGFYLE